MPEILNFKQEEEVLKNYKKIGLKCNPFPLGGAPSKDHPYVTISQKLADDVVEFVNSVTGTKRWQGLSIIGDNGSGKTRLLFLMENDINTQLKFANAIYVNDPPADPIKFFQKIIMSCNFDMLTERIVTNPQYLSDFVSLIDKNLSKKTTLYGTTVSGIIDEKKLILDFSNYLESKMHSDINITKGYSVLIVHYIISNILKERGIEISLGDFWISEISQIKGFLSGDKISGTILKQLGIKSVKVDKSYMEKVLFPALIQYNNLAGKSVVYALMDEFQFIIDNVSKSKIAIILDMIIAVAQSNPQGFCMVLSCLPDSWNYTSRISNSFLERFNKQLYMPNLSKEAAIKITRSYLNYGRINQSDKLFPFDENAIYKCLSMSKYNIRKFLALMGTMLTLFVKNKGKLIDITFVRDSIPKIKEDVGLDLWT